MLTLFKKESEAQSHGRKTYQRRPLTSYYRNQPKAGRSPFQQKPPPSRARYFLFGFLDILIVVLLLAGLVYSLILRPSPVVRTDKSDYHTAAVYSSAIAPLFSGVKNRNKLTFDSNDIITAIKKKFPEVQTVQIELPFFSQRPVVWLDISEPAYNLISGQSSYLIDKKGTAVSKSSDFPKFSRLLKITDQTGFTVNIGQQVLSAWNVSVINTIVSQARNAHVPIASLILPPKAQELDLRTADQPYFVKFNLSGDGFIQSGQFLAARHQFSKDKTVPGEYLDVRVPGKIFYK